MKSLLENLRSAYLDGQLECLLSGSGVEIIRDFLTNWDMMNEFYGRFYRDGVPKTVLCGLNPGRLGAGKTGVPLLDFRSLALLMPDLAGGRHETERSAQFFFSVIEGIGAERFFQSFYVTNISWVGYLKDGKNLNFYDLPPAAYQRVLGLFREEMRIVGAQRIIAIGKEVQPAAREAVGTWVTCEDVLQHPNYCSFPVGSTPAKATT